MPYRFLAMKGVPSDYPDGGAPVQEFDGSLLDTIANIKERRGTSSDRLTIDTAGTIFDERRYDCGATSGDARGMYLRLYLTGAAGGGEALRAFTTVENVAANTAHGAHLSLNFGTTGSLTGLGVAARCTLHLANQAYTGKGGTMAAVQAEIYSDGSTTDPVGITELSFIRVCNDGNASGIADVDDDAYLMAIVGGAIASGNLVQTETDETKFSHKIKIKAQGTLMYLMACDS